MDGSANRRSVLNAASRQKRARKPSARERVDEFVHKHPVGVPVGFAATVLLGGAIVGATAAGHASAPRDTGPPPPFSYAVSDDTYKALAQIYGPESKRTPAGPAKALNLKGPQTPQVGPAGGKKAPESRARPPILSTPVSMTPDSRPAGAKPVIRQAEAEEKIVAALYTEPAPDAQLSCGTHLVVLGAKVPVVCEAIGGELRAIRVTAEIGSLLDRWGAQMSVLGCMLSPNATIVEIDCGGGGVIPALGLYLRALAESQQKGLLGFLPALNQMETRKILENLLNGHMVKWVEEAEADEETEARLAALGDQSEDLWLVDAFALLYRVSVVVWSCEPGKAATRVHHTEIEESKERADLEGSMETHLNLRVANEHYTLLARL